MSHCLTLAAGLFEVAMEKHHAVRLHPKETCSCPESKGCYHILACELMSGKELKELLPVSSNPDKTNLQQQMRWKTKEKPAS